MKPLRLVIVTPRFWPSVGSLERFAASLAVELAGRGHAITVLTGRWRPAWPRRIGFREVLVIRMADAPSGGWATRRYVRSLRRWLQENRGRFDLAYVLSLQHDALAVLRVVDEVPVVLAPTAAGREGDCLWQIDAREGRRIKRACMDAAAYVAGSEAIQRELQAAGYPRQRIKLIPVGVAVPPQPPASVKTSLRVALAEASPAMQIVPDAPLAVFAGRLDPDRGVDRLLTAWRPIAARWPEARLWLAGAAADPAVPEHAIATAGLAGRALAVGVFDEIESLLLAADLFVSPVQHPGTSLAVLEAMAAGRAVVAADTPGNRAILEPDREGLLVDPDDTPSFSAAMAHLVEHPEQAARLGTAARQHVSQRFSLAEMVDRHETLMAELLGQPSL